MAGMTDFQAYLSQAFVAPEVFTLRPDYKALLMVVEGITPAASDSTSETLLQEAEASAKAQLARCPVTDIPHVASWRNAYKAFGSKPQKYRNSLEALTRRAEAGLPRVNRLTDIYNGISVKRQIPFGGEDLDKYSGPPRCIRATGKENFETTANGETIVEHPDVGEVVWCDDAGVTCRRWNWRQGPRTALTDETSKVLLIMDALDPITEDDLNNAADELVEALRKADPHIQAFRRVLKAPE
jgi:DNA/RNA-binding domain of Phe-tRNA-synthetase-like protein